MSANATIDPSLHVVKIAGYQLTGFADGTGFSSSFDKDKYTKVVGNRGLGAFTKTISGEATITLTMMKTSEDNDILSTIFLADEIPGGFLVPLIKTTANGRTIEGGDVRIMKNPDTTDSSDSIVWTLGSVNYTKFVGGYDSTPVLNTIDEINAAIAAAPPVSSPV